MKLPLERDHILCETEGSPTRKSDGLRIPPLPLPPPPFPSLYFYNPLLHKIHLASLPRAGDDPLLPILHFSKLSTSLLRLSEICFRKLVKSIFYLGQFYRTRNTLSSLSIL